MMALRQVLLHAGPMLLLATLKTVWNGPATQNPASSGYKASLPLFDLRLRSQFLCPFVPLMGPFLHIDP